MFHQVFNSIGSYIYNGIVYENWYFGNHFHNSFEFTYIIEGDFIAEINSTSIRLTPGDCILISPNIIHNLQQTGNNKFFTAVFSGDFVHAFAKKDFSIPFFKFVPEEEAMNYLLKYLVYTGTPELYTLKSCLYLICAQAVKLSKTSDLNSINSNFIYDVNTYISENLDKSFTRKDISAALNYEEHYFSSLFSKNFKLSLNKYVNLFRFEQACNLLLHSEKNITDIAFECGFTSIRTFNRVFKEYSGKSPNEYKNSKIIITEPDTKNQKVVINSTQPQ